MPDIIKKTYKEIIDETHEFYFGHPERKATSNGGCRITTEDGKHCAVGRCMTPEGQSLFLNSSGPSLFYDEHSKPKSGLENYLLPEYRGKVEAFWGALQRYHDSEVGNPEQQPSCLAELHTEWDDKD